MKMSKHVEKLLREGRNPKELVELGFPKSVITRVRRQLKKEKACQASEVTTGEAVVKGLHQSPTVSPEEIAHTEERLVFLENEVEHLRDWLSQLDGTVAERTSLEDMKACLDGTPALGLKHRFTCDCGASGFVALHIQCTKCGRETWWGWFPK